MALLAIGQSLLSLTGLVASAATPHGGIPILNVALPWSVLVEAVPLLFGIVLIAYRHQLAAMWFDDSAAETAPDPVGLLRIGLILVGFWLIVGAVQVALAVAVDLLAFSTQGPGGIGHSLVIGWQALSLAILSRLPAPIADLCFGLWFVLGSRSIASWLWAKGGDGDA